MDQKRVLKDILDLCKQAKFKESMDIMCLIDGEISNKWIMAIIIGCCNTCVDNISHLENISEDYLFSFFKHVVLCIKDVNEAELLSYLQSLFYILKIFIKKQSYGLIAKMDCILLPSFLPPSFPKKHIQTYQSSASLLYNLIVKTDSQEFEYLLEICNILSKIYSTVSSIPELFSTSYNCAIRLSNLSCPIEMLESYYFSVLSLAKLNTKKANTEDNFNNFLSHFTLICNSIFEKFDFVQATNFYERTLESATEIFNNDDCVSVLTVMKFPLLLSPLRIEDKLESLIQCKKRLINLDTSRQQLVVKKLQKLIHTIVSTYYKSENGSEWCKITEVSQSEILHVIWEISRLELSPKFSCPCKCQIEKNLYQAFSYIQYVRPLIEMPIKQKSASSDFYRDGANLLARFSEDVKELKKYNCKKWEMVWHALATALYNIGVKIHENSDRSCLPYFYTLIKYFVKFEFRDGVNILKFSIFYVFTVVCYYNVEDYKKRMALSALGVVLCPTKRNMLILNWIKAKSNQRYVDTPECNDLQKVTLVSAHKHFRNEMDFLTDGEIFLTTADKIDLLVFELEQYKMKWKSKVPTMCALKELCDIADLHKIVEVIVNIFWDYEALVHEDVPQILQKVLKQYEEKISGQENVQSTIFSAVLYHINYKHRVKDAIAKNATDMERALPVTQKTDEPPDAIPEDPKEECDIVSSYDSLTLTRYFGVMKYLNKSLELFASAITDNFDPGSLTKITSSTIYNSLVKISMEYRLHRLSVKHLQALQLALKVAQFENNACHIIWAISYIIESSDFNKSYVKYLISVADRQLDDIERASAQNLKIILTYYMCKANSLLYEDHEEAYRMFQMANELYDVQEDKSELKLVKCQLDTLHFKFVLLPCGFGIVDHRKSTLLTIHLANKTVYELYNDSKLDGAYEMSVLLDVNEELVKLYHQLRCPREVRTYCKQTILLSQQLVLPIRCAYYLVYLAQADLRSSRYDDSQVRIDGLADILCLRKYNVEIDQENKPPPNTEIEKDIADLTSNMQEMVLDLPIPENYKKQFSPSSPALVIQPFRLPAFLDHENDCGCFYCTSLEYQSLVLEKTRLDALLNVKRNNFAISRDFYHGALNFYKLCSKKYESSVESKVKFISYDLVPEFERELLGVYGFTLLDYSYHLMRTKNKLAALKVTNRLIDLVSSRKIQHVYLYNEALFQKLGYVTEVPAVAVGKAVEVEGLCAEPNVVSKTPESKHSKVTFMVQYTPAFSPPKRRVKKCLPFNLSPDEDTVNNKLQEKMTPIPKQPKTPAPKIKIYSNGDTSQKSKNPPTAIHIFTDESKKNKRIKPPVVNDSCSSYFNVIPKTPASTRPVNCESSLKTRTKLLTDKLRQSARKPEVPVVGVSDDDTSEPEISHSKKKSSLRKNLFKQENTEEPNVAQGGALRRSARRKNV